MVKKIALEEHFLDPATEEYWRPTMVDVAPAKTAQLYASLTDFGEQRLKMMEQHGIARMVLAIAGPGVQVERDAATALRAARASNDFLAKEVAKRPDRYSGFAHLPMQDAKAAADELERCVRNLKFCGAMINGHTNGKYLDDRSYDPFWERAAGLDAPIYLHPADPVAPCASFRVAFSIATRKPNWCLAILARHCLSCSGALTAVRNPMAGTCRSRRRNTSRKISGSRSPECMTHRQCTVRSMRWDVIA
jgi:2,3-dihydroxybenzoate decarboxylase